MMRSLALLLLCSLSLSVQAVSGEDNGPEIKTGNGFVRLCTDIEQIGTGKITDQQLGNIAMCTGYISGLLDGIDVMVAEDIKLRHMTGRGPICLPDEVTMGQEVSVVLKYVRAYPEQAHLPTALLAAMALKKAFPCPTR